MKQLNSPTWWIVLYGQSVTQPFESMLYDSLEDAEAFAVSCAESNSENIRVCSVTVVSRIKTTKNHIFIQE